MVATLKDVGHFVTVHRAEEAPLLGGAGGGLILTRVLKPTPNPSKEGNKSVGYATKNVS